MTRRFQGDELLIATHNQGKMGEYRDIFGQHGTLKSAQDIGLPDIEETGTTYLENAQLKALHGAKFSGLPALGDDSGFGIDALDGRPGLYTARFMRQHGSAEVAFKALHDEMKDALRQARFICALCLAWPDGHVETVIGEVAGEFIYPAKGHGGFGYDPVFIADGETQTFGENPDLKMKLSHRMRASQAMLEKCFK